MKIRKWDSVKVMSGKEKDRWVVSVVMVADPSTSKILVKDVNIVTRHIKKQGTNPGQIIKMEKAIDASNVMLVCPYTDKPTRIWFVKVEKDGKVRKYRFSKMAVKEKWGKPTDYKIDTK